MAMQETRAIEASPDGPARVFAALWRDADRWLIRSALVLLACVPVCAAVAVLDDRTLDGANVWHKPIKFQLSTGVFLVTLALMLPLAGRGFARGWGGRITVLLAVSSTAFEVGWITLQAGRGLRSHYATDTAFGAMMYGLMAIGAVVLSLTPVIVAIASAFARQRSAQFRTVRFGAWVATAVGFVGAAAIGFMLGGRESHFIGGDGTDATGLFFVGWSTTGGDLRIAHFVGLHAMQGLFVAGLLMVKAPALVARVVLLLAGVGWLLLTVWLARVALAGIPPWEALGL